MQQAITMFGAHLEAPGELEVTAQPAAGDPVLLVARRELAQAPIWVQHRPAITSPAPIWQLSLDAGDYLLTIGVGHAAGPVRIAFASPAVVVSIPPPSDRRPQDVVAFECLSTVTGRPRDPWPRPPAAPPRELPAVSRTWFQSQLLPLAAELPRGDDEPPIHALLIGVDRYLPSEDPRRPYFPSLAGCVADVRAVEAFLRDDLGVAAERITVLAAPLSDDADPATLPTYANIVTAWTRLIASVPRGEQIYVHFSGHGVRLKTASPALKGEGAADEAVVPCDFNQPGGRYLRDVEIAVLLRRMELAEQRATVVLDSCHAAGTNRGLGAVARTGSGRDTTDPPLDGFASSQEIEAAQQAMLARVTDGAAWSFGGGVAGFTVLAACQEHEHAYEFPFDGRQRRGALTYAWLETLRARWPGMSFAAAHQRVLAEVHRRFMRQSPALIGDGERAVLGAGRARRPAGIAVLDVVGDRVRLAAGAAAGLAAGSRLSVVPLRRAPDAEELDALPVIEVDEVAATESWARRLDGASGIAPGDQAILRRHGGRALHNVRITVELPSLRAAIADDPCNLLRCDDDQPCDLAVVSDDGSAALIADATGEPLPRQGDAIALAAAGAAPRLLARLQHLARFASVRRITGERTSSPFTDGVRVEPRGRRLRITNDWRNDVHITALHLRDDWSVRVVVPIDDPLQLAPGNPIDLAVPAGPGLLKVFVCTRALDLRWLQLPPLAEDRGAERALTPPRSLPTATWLTFDLET